LFFKRTISIFLTVLLLFSDSGALAKENVNLVNFQENFKNGNTTYAVLRNDSGKILQTKVGNQVLSTNIYDDENLLLKNTVYANGHTVNYIYNNFNSLIKKYYSSNGKNNVFTYSYDNENQLTQSSNSENNTVSSFSYDANGRLYKIQSSDGMVREIEYSVETDSLIYKIALSIFGFKQIIENKFNLDNMLKDSKISIGGSSIWSKYVYDGFGRIASIETFNSSKTSGIKHKFSHKGHENLIDSVEIDNINPDNQMNVSKITSYTYDNKGNIVEIKDTNSNLIVRYFYDNSNQLIRENNNNLNQTITYIYDSVGNIQEKKTYKFTDHEDLSNFIQESIISYNYCDPDWKDKMTSYNGQKITYDAIGNPVVYRDGWKFEWTCGKRLSKAFKYGSGISYKYDDEGIRTQKIINGVKTDYITYDTKILAQKSENGVITWIIDGNDICIGFNYNDSHYFYIKNAQNDIIGIADDEGKIIVNYTYNSWGNPISIDDISDKNIGEINPLRYRSYYYDDETGFYYLNSRYYDPETGRFVSADDESVLLEWCDNLSDINLFEYCKNNPVNMYDPTGHFATVAIGIGLVTGTSAAIIAAAATIGIVIVAVAAVIAVKELAKHCGSLFYAINGHSFVKKWKISIAAAFVRVLQCGNVHTETQVAAYLLAKAASFGKSPVKEDKRHYNKHYHLHGKRNTHPRAHIFYGLCK